MVIGRTAAEVIATAFVPLVSFISLNNLTRLAFSSFSFLISLSLCRRRLSTSSGFFVWDVSKRAMWASFSLIAASRASSLKADQWSLRFRLTFLERQRTSTVKPPPDASSVHASGTVSRSPCLAYLDAAPLALCSARRIAVGAFPVLLYIDSPEKCKVTAWRNDFADKNQAILTLASNCCVVCFCCAMATSLSLVMLTLSFRASSNSSTRCSFCLSRIYKNSCFVPNKPRRGR